MADKDSPKMSTCPICGYTDSATDAAMLDEDIRHHVRTAHNIDPNTLNTSASIKPEERDNGVGAQPAVIAPAPNSTNTPSGAVSYNDGEDRSGRSDEDTDRFS